VALAFGALTVAMDEEQASRVPPPWLPHVAHCESESPPGEGARNSSPASVSSADLDALAGNPRCAAGWNSTSFDVVVAADGTHCHRRRLYLVSRGHMRREEQS
jgi:hypothetical protein